MKPDAATHRRPTLALRIAIASAVFGLLLAGGTLAVGFWTLSRQLDERASLELDGRKQLLVHILSGLPSVASVEDATDRFSELFYGHDSLHLALVDPASGRVLAAPTEVASHSIVAIGHATSARDTTHSWVEPNGLRFTGTHGTAAAANGDDVQFYLSVDRRHDTKLLARRAKATVLALPWLLLIVALGAGVIARTSLAPLRRFNRLAASVGTQSLHQRVSMSGLPGDLQDLATEFNNMLRRIDDGYRQLEDFAGDLAHEMRTPVATLLGRTQVTLSRTRTTEELRDVLEGNVEELNRLSILISDMLFIARADHKAVPLEAEFVDLAREAQSVCDYMSLIADEKEVALHVAGRACSFLGDRLLIQRAITNLVSNAIRHASRHSTVTIEIVSTKRHVTLSVANEGEGIAPEHIERIFERFYRADAGRGRSEGGSGLGLAIVRSIVTLHAGSVIATSAKGRTTFMLSFPVPAPPVREAHGRSGAVPA